MPRYFLEVSYMGTSYSGFQRQDNANSIEAEVERCLQIFYKQPFSLTGSSRTDAGVHALQNYFHVDCTIGLSQADVYHLNAILPRDIVIKNIFPVASDAHCRFDAVSRTYQYTLYQAKDPFLENRAFFFPYRIDLELMEQAASVILGTHDFTSFSKKNTQVNNFICTIYESNWSEKEGIILYRVTGNRFLRGMVRGLVSTMLRVGTGKISVDDFLNILMHRNAALADFSVPGHGLMLEAVNLPF